MSDATAPIAALRVPVVGSPEAPYRGIEPFRVVDAPIFFERARESERLLRMITIYRGVLLYGESGAGKSSLVNAGFIPRCLAEGWIPERLRVQPRPGAEIVLERISRGGDGPPFLPSLLARDGEEAAREVLSAAELVERVHALSAAPGGDGAHETDGGFGMERPPHPVLVFEQFEEFVTLFQEAPAAEAREARDALLEALTELLRHEQAAVKLLFVFREDYLARLSPLFARSPNLPDQYLRLAPLPVSAVREVVRGPFEKVKGLFPRELSPELAAQLERALAARSERGLLNLSEVQIACLRLWEAQDPEALFQEAGVEGLLSRYLEDALDSLPAGLRDPAILVLTRLVTGAGTRNVVSGADLAEARGEGDPPARVLREAVQALERTALLRREMRHDIYFYEISSEFLVPWIRRKRLERLARLERTAIEARERGKRRRAYVASAVAALLIAVAALGYLYNLNRQVLAEAWVRQARIGEREAKRERDMALERARRYDHAAAEAIAQQSATLAQARLADSAFQAASRERDAALEHARTAVAMAGQSAERARSSDQQAQAALAERDAALERARQAREAAEKAETERDVALERARRADEAAATALAQRDLARSEAEAAERTTERVRREMESQRQAFTDSIGRLHRLLREAAAERDVFRDSTRALSSEVQQMRRGVGEPAPRTSRPIP